MTTHPNDALVLERSAGTWPISRCNMTKKPIKCTARTMSDPFNVYSFRVQSPSERESPESDLEEIIVHEPFLPGWTCRYDPRSSKYTFVHEHLPTSDEAKKPRPWSSMQSTRSHVQDSRHSSTRSSPNSQVPFRARTAADANLSNRIYQQFPNVSEAYINYLMREYHNRENLVISALLSKGYPRSNIVLDEALLYKLKAVFPNVELDIIRKLLIKNENREHSTIVSILERFCLFNTARYEHWQRPQLKLKFLKFLYPDVDERLLLDLLYNNEHKVDRVIKHFSDLGLHTTEPKMITCKITETDLVKDTIEKLNITRPASLLFETKYHPNLEEQETLRKRLIGTFPSIEVTLITAALESCAFDIEMAKTFLLTMTPQDSGIYLIRTLPDREPRPKKEIISCFVQTGDNFQDLFGNKEYREDQPRECGPCKDQSTWTKEDNMQVKQIEKLAKGPSKAKGPNPANKTCVRLKALGPTLIGKGHDASLLKGPQGSNVQYKTPSIGQESKNRKGPVGKQIVLLKEVDNSDD